MICNNCGKELTQLQKFRLTAGKINLFIGDISRLKSLTDAFKNRNKIFKASVDNLIITNLNQVKGIKPNKKIPKSVKVEQYNKVAENESRYVVMLKQYVIDTESLFQEMKKAVAEL